MNNKITYHKEGDYLIPDITVERQKKINLGKYGRARLNYIKEHKRGLWSELIMTNTLTNHLAEIDKTANEMIRNIINEMARKDNVPIYYNNQIDQLEWVKLMNNYKNIAEEMVYKELIYD